MSANDRQVGGTHYAAKFQHWDWVALNRLDYMISSISKYLSRMRKKGGVVDAEKSIHFIEKTIEFVPMGLAVPPRPTIKTDVWLDQIGLIGSDEALLINRMLNWRSRNQLLGIIDDITKLLPTLDKPPPYMVDTREVYSYSRFTYEGSKDGRDEYRCKHCRTTVMVSMHEPPTHHTCAQAALDKS